MTPAGGTKTLPRVGVPWSPKLVNVNAGRPFGAVWNEPSSGVRAVVHRRVLVAAVVTQSVDSGVVGEHHLTGLCIGVRRRFGKHLLDIA